MPWCATGPSADGAPLRRNCCPFGPRGHDYVLVARGTAVARPYPALLSDITTALKAAHKKLDAKAGDTHA
jgi:hypothetical protein